MKKTLSMIIALAWACAVFAQNTTYEYPVKPGDKAWKNFQSTAEMIAACQIPEGILKKMDTKSLLGVCLKYPLLNSYSASNSPYEGITNIISGFNGLTEFVHRKDAHHVLLAHYKSQDINSIQRASNKGGYTFDIIALELLLAQPQLIELFSKQERLQVLKTIMNKYEDKAKFADIFGFYGKMATAFVGNKYLEAINKPTADKNGKRALFKERMLIADFNSIDEVLLELQNYISAKN